MMSNYFFYNGIKAAKKVKSCIGEPIIYYSPSSNLSVSSFKETSSSISENAGEPIYLIVLKQILQEKLPSLNLEDLPDYIMPLSEAEKEMEYQNFFAIKDFDGMSDYLKNSKSVYHNLCGKFLNGQIIFNTLACEIHHIQPQYLNYKMHIFGENQIDQPFNLIKVSPSMHCILHFFRFLEFGDLQDYNIYAFSKRLLSFSEKERDLVE